MVSWSLVAVVAAIFTVKFAPEYSLYSSYLLTSTTFILISWIAKFVYAAILYPAYLTPLRQIPTPSKRSWMYGNTESFDLRFPVDLVREWTKSIPNPGLLRYYVIGNWERVVVLSPKAIADLLVNKSYDFVRPEIARVQLSKVTGEGLLVAEGDAHKAQRKSLMPSFSYRHIKELYPVFWTKAIQMTNEIEKGIKTNKSGEDIIKTSGWASRAMLDIIGLAGFDYDFNTVANPDNELARRYESMFFTPTGWQRVIAFVCLFIIGFKWYFRIPSRQNSIMDDAMSFIRGTAHEHLTKKKKQLQTDRKDAHVDILSVAMRNGDFTDENLVNQMMTFLGAGHETTSSAFQWAVYVLSKHPEIQTRLREELQASLPRIPFDELNDIKGLKDNQGNIKDTFSELFTSIDGNNNTNIPYLWAFTNEVLRFYPSAPFTSREAIRNTTLGGQFIPKGTHILVAPDITNKDTELWGPDAETFKPERWLNFDPASSNKPVSYNNSGGASSNYAMLTFIHGPRSCIGQGFARAELAIFVAVFVYRFRFELEDPGRKLEVRRMITQAPADGVVIRVRMAN
ncbi:cytochrome P450 monooxygenase, putative [Talaromyces stipitatus ATCC 10500]|uniref:Cytochrome P450 monooxygenase, putative n=1 Tax=Talaromyces stipitatus (strain ATCC 10500 / CBS 375.48 / QM 6759 / NRRL 1006) TaxID=441959 RepID=B8LV44_TALSN|nr:cytochrome P450 monooxygenase, putative [Talaromyces stipitatus ATCC 10500]EED23094.1 cytochrome P450 monooxygenase, putative [Talaromyces stipitatus ATCC 10500]